MGFLGNSAYDDKKIRAAKLQGRKDLEAQKNDHERVMAERKSWEADKDRKVIEGKQNQDLAFQLGSSGYDINTGPASVSGMFDPKSFAAYQAGKAAFTSAQAEKERVTNSTYSYQTEKKPMMGADGKPIYGDDGTVIMQETAVPFLGGQRMDTPEARAAAAQQTGGGVPAQQPASPVRLIGNRIENTPTGPATIPPGMESAPAHQTATQPAPVVQPVNHMDQFDKLTAGETISGKASGGFGGMMSGASDPAAVQQKAAGSGMGETFIPPFDPSGFNAWVKKKTSVFMDPLRHSFDLLSKFKQG